MNSKRQKIIARHFHVVGGGCFGTQYIRWLLRARKLGRVDFQSVLAVDRDPECLLVQEGLLGGGVQLVQEDWVQYLSEYLTKNLDLPEAQGDQWVPSPLSPHILFLGFLKALEALFPNLAWAKEEFKEEVPVPVRIPLTNGNLALSFAQWECPVNCIEPGHCPAIDEPRTWDMKQALQGYFLEHEEARSAHVLQCRHLVHGVGTIPCADIFFEFKRLVSQLKQGGLEKIAVATVSACHGLVGQAKLTALEAQTEGQDSDQKKPAGQNHQV